MKRLAFILAAALTAGPALGDVVHLKNGGMIEGQVMQTPEGVVIKLPAGEIRVSADAIARIEKKETPFEQYLKRSAAVKEDDPEAHYQLGLWAQAAGLKSQAREEFLKALALRPDHEGAHQALGHRRVEGKWVTPEQELEARGFVKRDGQWMTPEAAARFDALTAELQAQSARREAAEAELKKAQQEQAQAPVYTFSGYYSTPPAASFYATAVPYYGYTGYAGYYGYGGYYGAAPLYSYNPYALSFYYASPWSSLYYVRPYRYWPRYGGLSLSFGHKSLYYGHKSWGGHGGSHHGKGGGGWKGK